MMYIKFEKTVNLVVVHKIFHLIYKSPLPSLNIIIIFLGGGGFKYNSAVHNDRDTIWKNNVQNIKRSHYYFQRVSDV